MRFNKIHFWLSSFVMFLISIIIVHYSTPLTNTYNTTINSSQGSFGVQLGILNKLIKLNGVQDFMSLVVSSIAHHREKHTEKRDRVEWTSKSFLNCNATIVFTVDLKGHANFSSIQKAVDAVPESSSNTTLIIINSGIYRLIFLSIYPFTHYYFFKQFLNI